MMMVKMASPALILIFTAGVALGQDERQAVEGQALPLDMAVDSVDDQYQGCRDNMAELVKTEFLPRELQNTTVFEISSSSLLLICCSTVPPYRQNDELCFSHSHSHSDTWSWRWRGGVSIGHDGDVS
ncbi:hypothetical protein AALO_G00225370 [Alosa alosa]|uniref:Mono(ADP-ribosyl)transferase n=1 Tax=Alosa alosa TaxID=278164 RepID=A0AAV6FY75_9TELE|nr:hypothetical protein AALO_G00225370 [Alosa alosa]